MSEFQKNICKIVGHVYENLGFLVENSPTNLSYQVRTDPVRSICSRCEQVAHSEVRISV